MHRVDEDRQAVGDHHLAEEAEGEELEAAADRGNRPRPFFRLELRHEIDRADDRPGHQLREKRHEEQEIREVPAGPQLAAVDVDGVAHRLEGVERDAHRQQQVVQRQGAGKSRSKLSAKKL